MPAQTRLWNRQSPFKPFHNIVHRLLLLRNFQNWKLFNICFGPKVPFCDVKSVPSEQPVQFHFYFRLMFRLESASQHSRGKVKNSLIKHLVAPLVGAHALFKNKSHVLFCEVFRFQLELFFVSRSYFWKFQFSFFCFNFSFFLSFFDLEK